MSSDAFEQQQEFLQKINETINNMQAPLHQVVEATTAASRALSAALQSNAIQNALNLGQRIAQTIASYNFSPMLKKISEAMIPLKYIYLLRQLKWPLFLINDKELRGEILSVSADEESENKVKEIVLAYCDEKFLTSLENDWLACSAIKQERKLILSEALRLHKQGYYYASVSTLMCQLYGVAADIDVLINENSLSLDREGKELTAEHFHIDIHYINNEKGRLFQSLMLTESGILLWDAMGDYIKNVALYSGKDYSHIENQPLRNKIGHGDQLNFGTQEHSLKAILTIDMMIQLAYEINRIAETSSLLDIDQGVSSEGRPCKNC